MKTMHSHFSVVKLWIFNTLVIVFSVSDFQDWIKIFILLATLGYTLRKWWKMERKDKNKDDGQDND